MRRAVVRIDLDPQRILSAPRIGSGIDELPHSGLAIHRRADDRRLELLVDCHTAQQARQQAEAACKNVFGVTPVIETVSFISHGRDEDALGVVAAFGATAGLHRFDEDGEEVAVFTLPAADRRRIPESRLRTALEAALNCEVRLEFDQGRDADSRLREQSASAAPAAGTQ